MEKIKKILILRTEHIGDYILSLPLLRSIREKYPYAEISLIVGPWNKQIAEATPYVDKVIIFDNPLVKRHIGYKGIIRALTLDFFKLVRGILEIRKEKYDLFFILSNRKFNKVFVPFVRASRKVYNWKFDSNKNDKVRMKELLVSAGIRRVYDSAKLNHSKKDLEVIKEILRDFEGKKKIIVHAITPLEEKNWEIDCWAQLLNKLSKDNKNLVFFLIGAKEQLAQLELIKEKSKTTNVINLAGEFSLIQTALFIDKCDLFIGGDSGPKQLAEQLTQTPTLTLFGPTNEKMWGLTRRIDYTIKKDLMEDIKVDEVLNAAKKILKRKMLKI